MSTTISRSQGRRGTATGAARRPTSKWLVLAICCLSLFIVSMDVTIVNVALPSIRVDLGSSVADLQWVVDGYTVSVASFLLLAGSLADRIGRRRIFQIGLVVFSVGSLLCSVAPTVGFLIGARVLQGIGGSMLNPVAMSIITNTFSDRRQRARAVGIWAAVIGVSLAFGPLIGGILTETVGWRAVFWVNIPIGLAAIILTAVFVPESRAAVARRFDPLGQLFVIVALFSLVFALIEATRIGWGSPVILALFVLCAVAVAGLIRHEKGVREPLVDVRFFRSFPFTAATITAVCGFAAYGAFLFVNALYLQDVRGLSAFQTGLHMLPLAVATIVASLVSGRLVGRFGTRPSLVIAGLLIAAAALSMTFVTATTPHAVLALSYVLFGLGQGAINAPITTTAVSGMPVSQSGVAAGIASTSRQTGSSIGVALAGTVTGAGAASVIGPSFALATHPLWWIIVGCGLVIAALGVIATTAWARGTTERIGHLLAEPTDRGPASAAEPGAGADSAPADGAAGRDGVAEADRQRAVAAAAGEAS
ncbi:MFS transporter [Subtercola sp. YIM 133946]|uniref:MFS transporter n=1 Tax=Subtercola sp. YIM 133946 TaxID=3118909 RepID=UPI002F928F9A